MMTLFFIIMSILFFSSSYLHSKTRKHLQNAWDREDKYRKMIDDLVKTLERKGK